MLEIAGFTGLAQNSSGQVDFCRTLVLDNGLNKNLIIPAGNMFHTCIKTSITYSMIMSDKDKIRRI